jgi:hypothetical protein
MSDLNVEPTIHLVPGKDCPLCQRRYPYPKKETSPKRRVDSMSVPLPEDDEYQEIREAAAKHIGVYKNPYWKYRLSLRGCAELLAGPSAEESERET